MNVGGLLDRAFRQSVNSADVKFDATLETKSQGMESSARLEASGVYVAAEETLPKVDLDITFGTQDAGQNFKAGLLSTGDRAFLKFGGDFFEQDPEALARANRELAGAERDGGASALAALGVDPRSWVIEGKSEGEDELVGTRTEHVSARLDLRSVFADFNKLVERSGNAIGGVTPGTPKPLTDEQLDQVDDVVEDPAFDVYVGKDDDTVRRVSTTLEVRVPEADRERFDGLEEATLQVSIELSDVNGDQTVEAPADSRPIKDLTTQLGGLGALGERGLEGGDAPSPQDEDGTSTTPETTTPGGETPSPDGDAPEADALRLYTECLDQARPDDPAALERCNALLPGDPDRSR